MVINIYSDNVAPYRIQWAEALAALGNDVSFIYTKSKDAVRNDAWLVKESNSVKMVKVPSKIIKNHAITLNIIKHIAKNPADVIIFDGYGVVPNYLAILYMNFKRRPFFINMDGYHIAQRTESFWKRLFKKPMFGKNASFFCGSELTKRFLISNGVPQEKITVHNFSSIHEKDILSAPVTETEKTKIRISLGLDDKPTIIAVGRFLGLKRFDSLIRAFVPFDDKYQLLIVGEGDQKHVYTDLIQEFSLKNVKLVDFMPYEELKSYYKASDLFVLPSVDEIWGLVINEAMCFGLPCIATNFCIAAEAMIENGENGFVVDDSVSELGEKIKQIMCNAELREKMARASLRTAHQFTIEKMAEIHTERLNAKAEH